MPSTMPTSESRLLKEYMVDGEGLVPGFTLIQERELWEIIGTGVGIDFTVGLFVSGDNLVNHIQGKAVNSEEEDQEGPGDHFIFGLEKRLSNARIGDQKNNSIRAGGKKKHRPFTCRTLVFGISMIPCHFDRKTQVRASSVVGDRFLCGLYCPPSSSQLNRPRVHRKKRRRFSIFPEVPQSERGAMQRPYNYYWCFFSALSAPAMWLLLWPVRVSSPPPLLFFWTPGGDHLQDRYHWRNPNSNYQRNLNSSSVF